VGSCKSVSPLEDEESESMLLKKNMSSHEISNKSAEE
jgi:hypothetical protein